MPPHGVFSKCYTQAPTCLSSRMSYIWGEGGKGPSYDESMSPRDLIQGGQPWSVLPFREESGQGCKSTVPAQCCCRPAPTWASFRPTQGLGCRKCGGTKTDKYKARCRCHCCSGATDLGQDGEREFFSHLGVPHTQSPRFSVITFFAEMAFPVCSWNSRHFSGLICLHGLVRSLLTAWPLTSGWPWGVLLSLPAPQHRSGDS